jgi:hypothetical protein
MGHGGLSAFPCQLFGQVTISSIQTEGGHMTHAAGIIQAQSARFGQPERPGESAGSLTLSRILGSEAAHEAYMAGYTDDDDAARECALRLVMEGRI